MRSLMPQTLQAKFLAGLLLVMAALVGFFAFTLNLHLERLMEGEAREKASLILSQVEAVQGYIRTKLRPAMYRVLPEDQFVIEAMSTSYITRLVMSDLNLAREAFTYRRVGIGARNPDYEATDLERDLIGRFNAEPQLVRLEEFAQQDGERYFVTARPQRFEAACLHCHGDPAEAPRDLIERYGAERGFGRQVGQLAGIDLVRLKVQRDVGGIREATFSFAMLFAGAILVMFLVIQGFFNRLVVVSLRRVTGVMHRQFPEEAQAADSDQTAAPLGSELVPSGPRAGNTAPSRDDEIESLLHGFEIFAEHLRSARQDLKDYAATLEDKVAERTKDLTRLADERRADVALFVSLLNGLNESQSKRQLLFTSLSLIAGRFGAARAAYVCVLSATDFAAWPEADRRPELPEDWHELVSGAGGTEEEPAPRLTPLAWYIPVQTSGTSRGLLCLFWDAPQEGSGRMAELARAIGQQMGIAMDNLDAMDNLLRQNAMLSSLFEGIADPLMLVDARGSLLLANASARDLAADIMDRLLPLLAGATSGSAHGELILPGTATAAGTPGTAGGQGAAAGQERIFEADLYPLSGHGRDAGDTGAETNDGTRQPTREGAQPPAKRFVASLREVTAQRRMQGQLRQSERLAAVGQLAAGLAHEINNPLGVIQCYAELLRAAENAPQAQADLDVIMRHTGQAQKVVRDLLDFARPRPATPGPTDIAAQTADLVEVLRPRARAVQAELVLHAPANLPLVQAGSDALEHILSNILLNALDAVAETPLSGKTSHRRVNIRLRHEPATPGGVTPGGTTPGAATSESPDSVLLTVADSGPGIAPEHMNRVFDPFFSTKGVGKGTGLGLAVVYGLVRELGGSLSAANGEEGGAVFTVRLPAASSTSARPEHNSPTGPNTSVEDPQ